MGMASSPGLHQEKPVQNPYSPTIFSNKGQFGIFRAIPAFSGLKWIFLRKSPASLRLRRASKVSVTREGVIF
jgi:hypothetical protein